MPLHTTHKLLKEGSDRTVCALPIDGLHLVIKGRPTCPLCAHFMRPSGKPQTSEATLALRRHARRAYDTANNLMQLEESVRRARDLAYNARLDLVIALRNEPDIYGAVQRMLDKARDNDGKPVKAWQ